MMIARSLLVALVLLIIVFPALLCAEDGVREGGPIKELGRYDFGVAYDVFVAGQTAYVTGNKGVHLIDVQDPQQPRPISRVRLDDGAFGIFVEDDIAYVAGQKGGVFIIDVSDPGTPRILGVYSETRGTYHEDIVVDKDRGYVSLRDGRLLVLDISDRSGPRRIGELKAGADGRGLKVHQDIVYFASAFSGLEVVDVSDPSSPRKIGTVPGTLGASGVDIHDRTLFLGCHGNGVKLLDLSDPRLPRVIGTFNDGGESNSVFYQAPYLYVADQNDRCLEILEVGDPARPRKLAENDDDRYIPHDVFISGRYIYAADAKNGLVVFDYQPARKTVASSPAKRSPSAKGRAR
jgi:hypothetical protein